MLKGNAIKRPYENIIKKKKLIELSLKQKISLENIWNN